MKSLGTIFIILSLVLASVAISYTKPDFRERGLKTDMEELERRFGDISPKYKQEWDRDMENYRSERKERILWCAIPAGVLLITGLILIVVPIPKQTQTK